MRQPRLFNRTWFMPWNAGSTWLMLILLIFSMALSFLVLYLGNDSLDLFVYRMIYPYNSPALVNTMKFISFFGNHTFLIPANLLLIAYFLLRRMKYPALMVFTTAISSLAIMNTLKTTLQRERPADRLVEGITNFGFPSGHSFMSVAFFGLLIWWVAVSIRSKKYQWILITLLCMIVLLIGISRIYLRVHYSTDVIAGYAMGCTWLLICLRVFSAKFNYIPNT